MADQDNTSEAIARSSFVDLVTAAFAGVSATYGLRLLSESSDRVIFASDLTEVAVQLERGQVFVDIGRRGSSENFDLGEILLWKKPRSRFEYADPTTTTVAQELKRLVSLLLEHCSRLLAGDFREGPAILRFRRKRFRQLTGQGPGATE